MKVCAGSIIWGTLANNTEPTENYMIVVPQTWTEDTCNAFFQGFAGPTVPNGPRGTATRFGCMFPDEPMVVWDADPAIAPRTCGW